MEEAMRSVKHLFKFSVVIIVMMMMFFTNLRIMNCVLSVCVFIKWLMSEKVKPSRQWIRNYFLVHQKQILYWLNDFVNKAGK